MIDDYGWDRADIDPQTRDWIDAFSKQPPRENQTLDDLRDGYRAALIDGSLPPDPAVAVTALQVDGAAGPLDARLYRSAADSDALILYVHGGGFAVGDLDSHDSLAREIATAAATNVIAIAYRRAPEAKVPAARDDAVAAFRWCVANAASLGIDPVRIALAGESAGAAHAVAAALVLKAETPAPRAGGVMSPALDATCSGDSYRRFASGAGRTAAEFAYLWSLYAAEGMRLDDPLLSPFFADLSGLPALFIYPAEFDPAHDDGVAFADKARAAGVAISLQVRHGLVHQYPEIMGISDASRDAVCAAAKEVGAALRA